ncbi:hypothetical protein [Herbidospora sp. RD11066]
MIGKLLAALLTVTTLAACSGEGDIHPPPDGPWPQTLRATVEICGEGDICPPREQIEETMRNLPHVVDVRFDAEHPGTPPNGASYNLELAPGLDVVATRRSLAAVPGLSAVRVERTSFWHDKADVTILVCPARNNNTFPCDDRGQVTDDERRSIEAKLRTLTGVRAIYFEPADHRREVYARMEKCPRLRPGPIGAAYHLALDPGRLASEYIHDLRGLPAVFDVMDTHEVNAYDSNQVERWRPQDCLA